MPVAREAPMNPGMTHIELARSIAEQFASIPTVEAIALGGSVSRGSADERSDIDLCVYTTGPVSIEARSAIVSLRGAARADLNLQFWDPGDEWFDLPTGVEVDVIYWDTRWIKDQIDRLLVRNEASTGYTTCFWHSVQTSFILFDRNGWLAELKEASLVPFPAELQAAIVAKNHPLLRRVIPSYREQIRKAIERNDLVSINHRVTAFLESYFDVLFALNLMSHPGEKRQLEAAAACSARPDRLEQDVTELLRSIAGPGDTITAVDRLADAMDALLEAGGFDPSTSAPSSG